LRRGTLNGSNQLPLIVDRLKTRLEIEVLSAADAARRRQWSETGKLRIVGAKGR
jgi:hypothetical protein